jgi:hypothetical protein
MSDSKEICKRFFWELAADLMNVRPSMTDVMQCPLCLRLFDRSAVEAELVSVEHTVPGKLGGDADTLTCTGCNNKQGSALDSHLVKAMAALDGLEGKAHIAGTFHNNAGNVSANFTLRLLEETAPSEIGIVGKASNPAGVQAIPEMLYDGAELSFTVNLQFVPVQYWSAVMRVGYLALFQRLGYRYAFSEGAAQVRRVLDGEAPPQGIVLQAFPNHELPSPLLILPSQLQTVSFYIVVMRLQSEVTRHLAVLLPGENGCDWDVLVRMAVAVKRFGAHTTLANTSTEMAIRFDSDPISVLRSMAFPPREPEN